MAELTGKVIAVLPLASGVSNRTGNSWASQEYVIEEQGVRFPQRVCFKVFGRDKIEQFSIFPNEIITVKLELGCREHNGKWYNEISCWSVERLQAAQPMPQTQMQPQNNTPTGQWQQPSPHQQNYAQQPQAQYPPQGGYQQMSSAPPQNNDLPF